MSLFKNYSSSIQMVAFLIASILLMYYYKSMTNVEFGKVIGPGIVFGFLSYPLYRYVTKKIFRKR